MTDLAIRVEGLSKRYQIGAIQGGYRTLRDAVVDVAAAPFRRAVAVLRGAPASAPSEDLWALKDVSFDVKRGEALGIVGRNGAGKSTLLKVLSRITDPTAGRVGVRGRVGSLLEVGTGFHPELTGRENIYLNGAILGMRRADISRRFDEIVEFSKLERFLDTPVKHYSSGMYTRLAFAVAAHLEPEVLVVDEVLAVGDAEFQRRCLGKMESVAKDGRTVLFVSHNMGAVRALCGTAILLEAGRIASTGSADDVTRAYLGKVSALQQNVDIPEHCRIGGSRAVTIHRGQTFDLSDRPKASFLIGEPVVIRLWFRAHQATKGTFWFFLSSADGQRVLSSFQKDHAQAVWFDREGVMSATLDWVSLLPGTYQVTAGIFSPAHDVIDWVESFMTFEVLPQFRDGRAFDYRYGYITGESTWHLEQ
jgi:lipopolysaccharide transport system ATP-binding protein